MSKVLRFPKKCGQPKRVTAWQAVFLPLASILVFFLLLEGGLALLGVRPVLQKEDPFVGFAANVPLFVPAAGAEGQKQMVTAKSKLSSFNAQSFAARKAPGTYRIFMLGGSTTYGRPYNDATSFSGWLRELLPVADSHRQWEVINAGGISYASYRVAHLMEELIDYQPDLFIIYTGHNEFLEERTYGTIKEIPAIVRSTLARLSSTRTWSAMSMAIRKVGLVPQAETGNRHNLGERVDAILDKSVGLDRYTRDDPLQEKVLDHYRLSLERMVALARSVDAEILFVTPGSNLKDCLPFKSEPDEKLDNEARQRLEQMLTQARELIEQNDWQAAHDLLEEAAALDPRHAEVQYQFGQTLLALQRYEKAEAFLRRARDEDVCPLRALSSVRRVIAEVAREQGIALVDYVDLLEEHMEEISGHPIPGQELFLDHVHPTIKGHKLLAIALLERMATEGIVQLDRAWNDQSIEAVTAKIEGEIDQQSHAQALANLARVLLWAGKSQEATRLAVQAREKAADDRQILVDSASILTSVYFKAGQDDKARKLLYATLAKAPGAIEIRLKLGQSLLHPSIERLEEAAANLLLVCQQMPQYDPAFAAFGLAMVKRGRLSIAYNSLTDALRLNPGNTRAREILAKLEPALQKANLKPVPSQIELDIYPSGEPHKLVQLSRDGSGRLVRHGIEVEFYRDGRIKRFVDFAGGEKNGLEKFWDKDGNLISQEVYKLGHVVEKTDLMSQRDE